MQNAPRRRLAVARVLCLVLTLMLLVAVTRVPATPARALPIDPALDAVEAPAGPALATTVRLRTPFGQHTLYIIGDSLTVGADVFGGLSKRLTAAGYTVRINGNVGRTIAVGNTILATEAAAGRLEPVVMVALGTNDVWAGRSTATITKSIDDVMATVGNRWVIWVNIQMRDTVAAARFNLLLRNRLTTYPRTIIADWSSTPNLQYMQRLGIHYSPAGYLNRAIFLVDYLELATGNKPG